MTTKTLAAMLAAHVAFLAHTTAFAATPGVIAAASGEPVPIHKGLDGQLRPQRNFGETHCSARDGDEIEIVRGMKLEGDPEFWILVKVRSGPCSGTEGWIRGRQAKPLR